MMIPITPPPIPWLGLDTAGDDAVGGPITAYIAEAMHTQGYRWVARYLRLDHDALDGPVAGGDHRGCYSLSRAEIDVIHAAGLLLLPVQWGPDGQTTIDAAGGHARGVLAASQAQALGLPRDVHLWCDLEGGPAARAGADACIAYVGAWAAAVLEAGYRAGLYTGDADVPLSGRQSYGIPGVTSYWRSATAGGPHEPAPRGWAIHQRPTTRVAGMLVDTDMLHPDALGDMPYLVGWSSAHLALWTEAQGRLSGWWLDAIGGGA